jgi:maltooligosyltrehalose trehalohydrolase
MLRRVPDPGDPATFERCKLDDRERERESPIARLHSDLLRLRRSDPTLGAQGTHGVDGAVLGSHAFVLRLFGGSGTGTDRLILVNLGSDLSLPVVPEPLLAPPSVHQWDLRWSSEAPEYGGAGILPVETNPGWHLPGESAVLLAAVPAADGDSRT